MRIIKTKQVKIRKKHECFVCHKTIQKGDKCINSSVSYDSRLLNIYFCGCITK